MAAWGFQVCVARRQWGSVTRLCPGGGPRREGLGVGEREPGEQASYSLVSLCPFHDTLLRDKTAGRAGRGAWRRQRDSAVPYLPAAWAASAGSAPLHLQGRGRGACLSFCKLDSVAAERGKGTTLRLPGPPPPGPQPALGASSLSRWTGGRVDGWTGGGRVPGSRTQQQEDSLVPMASGPQPPAEGV